MLPRLIKFVPLEPSVSSVFDILPLFSPAIPPTYFSPMILAELSFVKFVSVTPLSLLLPLLPTRPPT